MFLNEQLSQTNVLPVLERLASLDIPLTLTRFFDGLLLKQDVHLMSVNQDTAVFRAEDLKTIAAPGGRKIQLHHWAFARPIRGRLHKLALDACMFILCDLAWGQTGWKERSRDRVQPKRPTYCTLSGEFGEVTAAIMDVDAYGIGVLAKSKTGGELGLVEGAPVQLDFTVSPKWKWQRLPGKIVNQAPVNNSLNRVGIQLQPKPGQARFLEQYTNRRKEEILGALEQAYHQMQEPRRVEDLYF